MYFHIKIPNLAIQANIHPVDQAQYRPVLCRLYWANTRKYLNRRGYWEPKTWVVTQVPSIKPQTWTSRVASASGCCVASVAMFTWGLSSCPATCSVRPPTLGSSCSWREATGTCNTSLEASELLLKDLSYRRQDKDPFPIDKIATSANADRKSNSPTVLCTQGNLCFCSDLPELQQLWVAIRMQLRFFWFPIGCTNVPPTRLHHLGLWLVKGPEFGVPVLLFDCFIKKQHLGCEEKK